MTADELISCADRAWHEARMEEWQCCMWLLRTLYGITDCAAENTDAQSDYQNEAGAHGVTVKDLLR